MRPKTKEIDLVRCDIKQETVMVNNYYCVEVLRGQKHFYLGFTDSSEASLWLEVMLEIADDNAAGRRAWVASLRRMLNAPFRDRRNMVEEMAERDWLKEWTFCLRALKNKEDSVNTQSRRLKRLFTNESFSSSSLTCIGPIAVFVVSQLWMQFHIFAEALAEIFFSSIQKSGSEPISRKGSAASIGSNGALSMVSPRVYTLEHRDDVDIVTCKCIRLEFATKSWRGHKRIEREMFGLAQCRIQLDELVTAHKLEYIVKNFPTCSLTAAFTLRDVRVVVTAEPPNDECDVVSMDKKDLTELQRALRDANALTTFPFQELPEVVLRRHRGSQEQMLLRAHSRYDDIFLNSLRSPLMHGILLRAEAGEGNASTALEFLSIHDVKEMIEGRPGNWIPYLDLYYYQLDTSSEAPENLLAKRLLLKHATDTSVRGDIIVMVDDEQCRLSWNLKERFVLRYQMDLYPFVRRLQEIKKNITWIAGANRIADPRYSLAEENEQNIKRMFRRHVRLVASKLVTLGDVPPLTTPSEQPKTFIAGDSSNHRAPSFAVISDSLNNRTRPTPSGISIDPSGVYVSDAGVLRQVMNDAGINIRFLPLLFKDMNAARQPGMLTLVASEIVARLAKALFKYQYLYDERMTKSKWKTRKFRIIMFIDSIMHGLFHRVNPYGECNVEECSGDQFWLVDAPIWHFLGPFGLPYGFDHKHLDVAADMERYRSLLRRNPGLLFSALLRAFGMQLSKSVLPSLTETRFVSMPFLRTPEDIIFDREENDPTLEVLVHSKMTESNFCFFNIRFNALKKMFAESGGKASPDNEINSFTRFMMGLFTQFRQTVNIADTTRLERAVRQFEELQHVRIGLKDILTAVAESQWPAAKRRCQEVKESIESSSCLSALPIEYVLALRILDALSEKDVFAADDNQEASSAWVSVMGWLRYFFRPSNTSQFASCSSSHPVYMALRRVLASSAASSLRGYLQQDQMEELWSSVLPILMQQINSGFARKGPSSVITRAAVGRSHSLPDDEACPADDDGYQRSTSDPMAVATAVKELANGSPEAFPSREDLLRMIEFFFLEATTSLWWIHRKFLNDEAPPIEITEDSVMPVYGCGFVWGKPMGLSLDEEAQLQNTRTVSGNAKLLQARPADTSSVRLIHFPPPLRRVIQVSCGYRHTALVTDGDRQLLTFGYGECGRLGHGDEESVIAPMPVSYFSELIEREGSANVGIMQVSCGREHTMVVLLNGDLYGFGWAEAGRIGTGDSGAVVVPTKVTSLENVTTVTCGREHTLTLNANGEVYAFGAGFGGRLGNGLEDDAELPVLVKALRNEKIMLVDAGECHSCAVNRQGEVFTWGFGSSGALGNGSRENALQPEKIEGPWSQLPGCGIIHIACGSYHTIASASNGKLYGWGDCAAGQLGEKLLSSDDMVVLTPHEIEMPSMASTGGAGTMTSPNTTHFEIACGTFTSAVVTMSGRVYAWGSATAGSGVPLDEKDACVSQVHVLRDLPVANISCEQAVPATTADNVDPNLRPKSKRKSSGAVASMQLEIIRRKRMMMRRQSSIADVVRGNVCSKPIKGFLYGWAIMLIIMGIGIICMSMFMLYYQGDVHLVPSLAYYIVACAGAALVAVSATGIVGLGRQRQCVTEGRRNYALAAFVILSVVGSIIILLGGSIAMSLINTADLTGGNNFRNKSVKLMEEAIVTTLGSYAQESAAGWRGFQNDMACCGYESISKMRSLNYATSGRYDDALYPVVMQLNNITGSACLTRRQECQEANHDDTPCPSKSHDWCRVVVLQHASSNYTCIGLFALIMGGAQLLSTILATYTLLCDVRMMPKKKSQPIDPEPASADLVHQRHINITDTAITMARARDNDQEDHAAKRLKLDNLHVTTIRPLVPPACVIDELPVTPQVHDTVSSTREAVSNILHGRDDRLVVVVGPCSIHDVKAAMDYAERLKKLADELSSDLLIIMRTYFEKPRTTIGWKGLINDPDLNQSFDINKGIRIARKLLLDVNALGLPVSLEFLDTISPQFTADLISWGAIGARTTESQLHRELTSGLSMPVGFKNGTGGDVKIAVDAAVAASTPHNFLGLNEHGLASIVMTKGNSDCHVILRGGTDGPNYEEPHINAAAAMLEKANQPSKVMVDCSHGNSRKQHKNQLKVAQHLAELVTKGNTNILGLMIESNIVEGNQKLGDDPSKLEYGKSITDACIDWDDTVMVLRELAAAVATRREAVLA
ncbi:TPA: hypothetical protein N0F65_003154 [Lagenidium giganteum]|uniref:3-deoxy-7-phosphoheptulonate synthase n=1 Tax=Lagenidium giganteum TaxID=4803 RepID=A0AAV2Z6I7_9STRA|nr:TPA: hypothetical protein N0F65_003154 [Lagenidium giganteum]